MREHFPVAGLMEGSVSIGIAVAAISGILTDFEVRKWPRDTGSRQYITFLLERGTAS